MPKVSVVIPTYNSSKYIEECIESVLRQTFQDFEIIISDDGSQDDTIEKVLCIKDPRIKINVSSINCGIGANHAKMALIAQGEYIARIDADDVCVETRLEKQVEFLDQNPNIGLVSALEQRIDEDSNLIIVASSREVQPIWYRNWAERAKVIFYSDTTAGVNSPSTMFRRKYYTLYGINDNRYILMEDTEFFLRLCLNKVEFGLIKEHLIKRRIRENNSNNGNWKYDTAVKFSWEKILQLDNFKLVKNIEDLEEIFSYSSLLGFKIRSKELIPFVLAMLALKHNHSSWKIFAMRTIYELFKDKNIIERLHIECGFTQNDLVKLAGTINIIESYDLAAAKLYLNSGEGFKLCKREFVNKNEKNKCFLFFSLNDYKDMFIKELLIEPTKHNNIKIKINAIYINDRIEESLLLQHNGEDIGNSVILFKNAPQLCFSLNKSGVYKLLIEFEHQSEEKM